MKENNRHFIFVIGFSILALHACAKKNAGFNISSSTQQTLYHCAMHPQIISDKPGECPICHMRLTPILKTTAAGDQSAENGLAPVNIGPQIQQQIGVVVSTVTRRELVIPIRAAARVAYDPQLYNATLEHQEAAAFLRKARDQGSADLVDQAQSTLRSSEIRLRQMGLSSEQIAAAEEPGYDASGLLLGSNRGGKVTIYANVFNNEASFIRPGEQVELNTPSSPGKSFVGAVKAIDPIVNNETRTLRVRIEATNLGFGFRPESYLTATIMASIGIHLAVPQSAIMDTGVRQLAYVEKRPGIFEPREVAVGQSAGDDIEILSGLTEGERVVTSANFLIDSESRIQAATIQAGRDNAHD